MLDNIKKIKKYDPNQVLESIAALPKQCVQTWEEVKQVKIPEHYQEADKIIVCGMGGSALGIHIIENLFADELKAPVIVVRGYNLPKYADDKSLIVLSSYSGTTEEALSCAEKAKKITNKITGITVGEKLGDFLESNNYPYFKINPIHNPSKQPRVGLGYSILGLIGLLNQCGMISLDDKSVDDVISHLEELNKLFGVDNKDNTAKTIAQQVQKKIPVIVASNSFTGNAHVMANQFNETAKEFSAYHIIPELNHHLLEGLLFPQLNPEILFFLFFQSNLDSTRVQARFKVTADIVEKNAVGSITYKLGGKGKLEQSFEMLLLGSYITFYLAMLNKQDPSKIPWVDYLKEQLAKLEG